MSDDEVRAILSLVEPTDDDDDRTRLMDFFASCYTGDEVTRIRETIELYSSGDYDAYVARYDERDQDVVRACLPFVDKAIVLHKVNRLLEECPLECLAGLVRFVELSGKAEEVAA